MKNLLMFMLSALLFFVAAAENITVAEYGIGHWPEKGRGNHRALVEAATPAKAVRVKIPWRRTDSNPARKKIVVIAPDGTTDIAKVQPVSVTPMWGDIVFEAPAAGVYTIYWLPYTPWENWNDPDEGYYNADYSANTSWYQSLSIDSLPIAKVIKIEANGEFNSFWPMEVPAMPGEMEKMKSAAGYAVFTEDRSRPVKMFDAIPVRWLENGPSSAFNGKAQPGEFYPFQIAVWSFAKELEVDLLYSDLKSESGEVIPASVFECINIDITEFSGRKRHTPARVAAGKVQPLWVIARIPMETPPGVYRGECTVKAAGLADTVLTLQLEVGGETLADGGVSESWRLTRLAWLNSAVGIDDTVPAPFKPIEFSERKIKVAMAEIDLSDSGLPEKITVAGRPVFAAAPQFNVSGKGLTAPFQHQGLNTIKKGNDRVEWQGTGQNGSISYRLDGAIESDGMFDYALTLTPERDIVLDDLSLILPVLPESAKYIIGLGVRGGKRTADVNWKWNPQNATNYIWLGDYNRGIQLHLIPGSDAWEPMSVTPSPEWDNKGLGGITVVEKPDHVAIRAYSGKRPLKKGETITFRFQLNVTPCREQTAERWNWRFRSWGTPGNMDVVFHGARGNPNINYPFSELQNLGEEVDKIKNRVIGGVLSYKAADRVSRDSGYVESELRINFDPATHPDPIALPYVNFKDRSAFGTAWIPAMKGIRLIAIKYDPSVTTYPFEISVPNLDWKQGEKHRIGFSWHNNTAAIWIDGQKAAEDKFNIAEVFTKEQLANGNIAFTGATHVGKVRAGIGVFQPGRPGPDIERTGNEILFDRAGEQADKLAGGFRRDGEYVCLDGGDLHSPSKATIYFTVREMSALAPELWAFRSLPDNEIFSTSAFVYTPDGAWMAPEGTGTAWLREHLGSNYSPAWKTKTYSGERDFAIGVKAPTRWHNWYLAGVDFLSKRYDVNGMYLDSFGAGREVAKRLRKVLLANNPAEGHLWWHAGNNFDFLNNGSSIYSTNMDALPFYSQAWNGEAVDFNHGPDYYLIELSGIPFGIPAEMLEHHTGGHPFRGMVYGMGGRIHPSAAALHALWDSFGIADAQMIGYWTEKPVVEPDNPNMRASAYVHHGDRALIAIGEWPSESGLPARTAIAGRRTGPVKIDGRPDEAAWQNALVLNNFTTLNSAAVSEKPTEARVMWDENMLYFSFICRGQDVSKLIAAKHRRDDNLWEDDSIELYLRPSYTSKDWIQFIGNSRGVFMDSKNRDAKWNGIWQYAARVENGYWCGEGAVSWQSLGIDGRKLAADGGKIGFNFCRTMHLPAFQFDLWAQKPGVSPASLDGFGQLILAEKAGGEVSRSKATSETTLKVDFAALGLDPAKVKAYRPEIEHMQQGGPVDIAKPIEVVPGTGAIIILEAQK